MKIIVLLCTFTIGHAQEPKQEVLVDRFIRIHYHKDEINLGDEGMLIANLIGDKIKENTIPKNFRPVLLVVTCVFEKESDSLIGYKRVDFLLNYLKQNYNIDSETFLIEFDNYGLCDIDIIDAYTSYINFTVQKGCD